MKKVSTLKLNLMRAAMTLALIVTCAAAWAGTVTVNIIGSGTVNVTYNGTTTEENINSGWNMTLSGSLTLIMIPAQGYTLQELQMVTNLGSSTESTIENNGVYTYTIENVSFYDITYTVVFSIPGVTTYTLTGDGMTFSVEGQTVTSAEEGQRVDITLPSPGNHSYWVVTSSDVAIQKDDANHFHFTMPAKSVIVNAQQYYQTACYVNDESTHGHVMVNGNNAGTENHYADETITLTPVADAGYEYLPGTLTATNINTNESINLTDNGDGTWSFTMPNSQVSVSATFSFDPAHITMSGNEYTIHTATGWGVFCDALLDKDTYNGFSGKTVYLANDIEVSRMAGSGNGSDLTTSDHPFCGTFDGQGNTLTFNYGSSDSPANENNLAPFRYVNDATIQHLHVSGDIYTQQKHTGGIVGQAYGTTNITDCHSSINIISSITGDGTHGGIMSCSWTGSTTNISGCLFDGSIQSADGYTTDQCGGFVGWKNATINVTNSLLTADLSTIGAATGETYPSATFVRHGVASDITNCYYVTALGTVQGKQRLSITADENVTVANAGTPVNVYTTSGITSYGTGIKYNDVLYAGSGDNVSLTLGNTPPQGSIFMGYTVSPEGTTLNGTSNPYTLTMPDEDVIIGAVIKDPVTYLDENGVQQTKQPSDYTLLTGSETSIGSADQETWYVADGTINFNHTINVNGVVHLILKDNAVMNVGTEQNPISDSGISAEGPSISIYGQSTGENIGQLYVYATYCGIYDYDWYGNNNNPNYDYAVTINGGYIYLNSGEYGIQSNKVTINGGQVYATAGVYGIASYSNAITLGWTSPYDLIYADAYQGDVIVKSGKAFINNDHPSNNVVTGTVSDYSLINGMFLQPAVAVTLNDGITAGSGIISSGENLYAQAAVDVTVDASSVIAPPGYAVSGITVTPTVTVTDNGNGIYSFTTPAADVTVNATFALQPVSVNYLDENGQQQTHDALPLLGGGATTLAAGWYVVNSNISYTGTVTLVGNVNLILADDCHMNIGTSESRINDKGIREYTNGPTLTIYGQSTGDHMGTLGVYTSASNVPAICTFALTINGGHVIANTNKQYATALSTSWQPITINGGIVEATATGNGAYAIHSGDNFTYAGGTLITNAASENAIKAYHGCYTFTWRNPNDSITIGSTGFYDDNGSATATFTKAFTDGTNIYSGTLTGSQLNALAGKTLHPVTAYKTITAHSTTEQPVSGWYLIASPVGDVSATAVNNLITTESDYDLYYFDQTGGTNGLEWKNYKAHHEDATNPFNALVSGQGYLYANSANVNLIFTGTPYSGEGTFNLERSDRNDIDENMRGWNLMGNPFAETAYIVDHDFYVMNDDGSEIVPADRNYVEAMEGIFVYANEDGGTVTFTPNAPSKSRAQKPEPEQIVLNLSGNGGSVIDRAIVRFIESRQLPKFQIRKNSTKIYIPQDGKDYAIVSVGNVSEIPVNFKAEENGTYTLTVSPTLNSQLSTLNYLHLIDNMTGADIDLIPSLRAERSNPEPPVSYAFTAKTTDYESRFKLVFIANDASTGSASDATFAFVSNGSIIVNGEGTLQVIDLMGRVIRTVGLSQCGSRTSTAGMTPCVYVLRLINGDNVRTQKIVIP